MLKKIVMTTLSLILLVEGLERKTIVTTNAPSAIGPYSQGILTTFASGEKILQAAGQIGLDPQTGRLVDGGIESQAKRTMENVKAIVEAAGGTMDDVVECTVLMKDLNDYAALNKIYATYFDDNDAPARAAFQVVALPANASCEIKCSATF